MTATVAQALARAEAEHRQRTQDWTGWCQKFTRTCWGVPPLYPSAAAAWRAAKFKHTSWPPPPGAPVFWTGGFLGFGHAAISTGGGNIWSTDILRRGEVDHVALALITQRWGLHYEGWTGDINDVTLPLDPGGEDDDHEPIPPDPPPSEETDMQYLIIADAGRGGPAYAWTPTTIRPINGPYFQALVRTGVAENKIHMLPTADFDMLKDMTGFALRQAAAIVDSALQDDFADLERTAPKADDLADEVGAEVVT